MNVIVDPLRHFVSHNRGLVVTLMLALALTGCSLFPFKTTSPTDGSTRITREQLNAEIVAFTAAHKAKVDEFAAKAKAADEELARKEATATLGLDQLNQLAAHNGLTGVPTALAGGLALMVAGLGYDNKRKDTQILLRQRQIDHQSPTPPQEV